MNFESPSQCKGNVTGWRFCYYQNSDLININRINVFSSVLVVFRRQNSTSNYYSSVQGSIQEKTLDYNEVYNTKGFMCIHENLKSDEYFEVQENDIIGACIQNFGSNSPLLLVGRSIETNRLMYVTSLVRCNIHTLRNSIVSASALVQQTDLTLHLYADIGKL